jgi:cyclase
MNISKIILLIFIAASLANAADPAPENTAEHEKGFFVLMDRDPDELPDPPNIDKITTVPIGGGIYVLQGAFSNTGICIGDDSVVMVDPSMPEISDAVVASVRALTDKPIEYVINTHWHWDHTGANENMAKLGATLVAQEDALQWMTTWQISGRAGTPKAPQPPLGVPGITFSERMNIDVAGCPITLTSAEPAHTKGDAIVYFSAADIYQLGDIYLQGTFPYFDLNTGGNINGLIATLDKLLAEIGPDTVVIPGHGAVSNGTEMREFRNMAVTVRERVQGAIDAGKSKDETVAMNLTADLDEQWGNPFVTGPFLTTIVYVSLTGSE